ncbi:tetratricopeptide repeat protein [Geobacter sp. AOG1]|uniref:tetratricopeptide repeat protein n=1 Tax=Geobacter sp. AOG1 TaxID=1566346 RepID=UPI001CC46B54|nr:tetratricopeptide repeat protein [Geobacter sp. AOG1]
MKKNHIIALSAVILLICILLVTWRSRKASQNVSPSPIAGLGPTDLINRSVDSMKESAAKNPSDASGYVKLGNFYLDHSKSDEALEAFQTALKIDPKHGPALENLGFIYYQKKDYANALTYLNMAREIIPDSPTLHNTLGAVYREQKQYEKALEEYRKTATLQKEAPYSWYNIALIYQEMKSPEEATAWEKYLSVASGIPSEARYVEIARQNLKKISRYRPQK